VQSFYPPILADNCGIPPPNHRRGTLWPDPRPEHALGNDRTICSARH